MRDQESRIRIQYPRGKGARVGIATRAFGTAEQETPK